MKKIISTSLIWIVIFLNSNASFAEDVIIKPQKITASSELKFYPGHTANFAGDGKVSLNQYWCSDFKNGKKPPHWLEFDFGSPKKFNQIQLFMHPKYKRSLMLNDFSLEYWNGKAWRVIVDQHDYITHYLASIRDENPPDKYTVKVPNDSPVFRFQSVTADKVRLYITKTGGGNARLHEMTVSLVSDQQTIQPKDRKTATKRTYENDGLRCFDFGPDDSKVKSGFLKVSEKTAYSATSGYGWRSSSKLTGCDRMYPNDLKRDFIFSAATSTFRLNLPNGEYYVYLLSGDTLFPSPSLTASVNGSNICIPPSLHGEYASEKICVEVASGKLEIKFKAPFLVNALIVAPRSKSANLDAFVTKNVLFDLGYYSKKVKFTKEIHNTNRTAPKISEIDKKNGFICYIPSIQDRIFQDTTPKASQCGGSIETGTTLGESKAATFCVYAIKPLRGVVATISDLKSDSRNILKKKNIDIKVVKCWPQRTGHKGASKTWDVIPELLEKASPQTIDARTSRQFWLTFNIPENAKSGDYSGAITVSNGEVEKKINVLLRIYPFRLESPNDVEFGVYPAVGRSHGSFCTDPKKKDWDLKQLRDMRAHGMNTIVLNFKATIPVSEIIKKIGYCNSLLNLAEFPQQAIPWSCRGIDNDTVKTVRDAVAKNGWREILFYPIDEPFGGTRLDIAAKVYPEIKKVSGIRTYSTVYQASVDRLGKNLDVRCYGVSGAAKFDANRMRRECAESGTTFWWYSNCTREYPAVVRFKAGFFFWKSGAQGQFYWAYANARGDQFNDFDTSSSDHCTVYFKGNKIISTIQWECMREGINDFKYIYTLEQAIKKYAGTKKAECEKAKILLDEIRKETIVDLKEYKKRFGDYNALHIKSIWAPEKYDEYRREIAKQINSFR